MIHPTISEFADFLIGAFHRNTLVGNGDDIPEPKNKLAPETVEYIDLGLALQRWRNEQDDKEPITVTVTKREHSMIIAGLRLYQASDRGDENINDIASDGDTHEPLDDNEIDDLIEKIN